MSSSCVDVEFSYPGAAGAGPPGITFAARPGQTTAIIGSTGAGKTTLMSLIPRLFDVTSGSVRVDGVDVRDLSPEVLWRRIGLVPQRPYLFTGTVASNLRYGDPDATDEQLWHALEIAQARDFVEAMPQGLETPIAQGGTNVSGGQRQRLSIARALVVKPEIYLFDDSFSALDLATDARLRAALRPLTRDATVVIVAQRVSTIIDADQIVVLEDGGIVGVGTHDELLESCPTYGRSSSPSSRRRRRHEHGEHHRGDRARGRRGGEPRRAGRPPVPPRRLPPGGARGHGPMAGMGMPAEKSMTFGPSARRLIGRLRPRAGARRRWCCCWPWSASSSPWSGPRSSAAPPTSSSPASSASSCPRAARRPRRSQGARASGNSNFADMLARMDVVPGRGIDFTALGQVLLAGPRALRRRVVLRLGRRATCSTTSCSARSSGCAPTSRTSSTGCRCRYFDQQPRGELLSRVTNDIDNISPEPAADAEPAAHLAADRDRRAC